jgi:hypothetical protein
MVDSPTQDVFISHASADKTQYVYPLTEALSAHQLTFWLDDAEITWGDNVVAKVNQGLRSSRFALVCLSANFLQRRWPEAEMAAVLSIQNSDGVKRVLPLILNSKEDVLRQYPLLAALAYREFAQGPETIASEVARVAAKSTRTEDEIVVTIEGVHTGKLCRLKAPRRASIEWLAQMAQAGMEVQNAFQVGPVSAFRIRWVLVDVAAEEQWLRMSRRRQREVHAIVTAEGDVRVAHSPRERLEQLGIKDGTVFHMYAIEDEDFSPPPCAAPA